MISVCIATYNGERYLADQLASVLESPLVSEVVLSDDGSRDRTLEVVRQFADTRIRLIEGPRAGLVRNYEYLLSQARGEQIFLADQDDIWLPDKVPVMSHALKDVDLVLSDCIVVDSTLNVLQSSFFATRPSKPGLLRNLAKNSYLGCCMAFDRRLLAYALPFPPRLPMHDWWLGLVAETFGTVGFVHMPLVKYRRHDRNASSTSTRSTASMHQQVGWRARIAAALVRRWLRHHTSQALTST